MNGAMIGTLVLKDLKLYFRNRFFAFITVLALVFYIIIYYVMPNTVDETLKLGLYAPQFPAALLNSLAEEGLVIQSTNSEQELQDVVLAGDVDAGFVLPPDVLANLAGGTRQPVTVYVATSAPPEFRDVYKLLFEEIAATMVGQPLQYTVNEEILGPDLAGAQIPPRDRMLPLFAVVVLMMETLGLASLVSSEVEAGTIRALLVTPLRMEGLFLAKGIMGVSLAMVQVVLLMLVTGGLDQQPLLILVALLLGSMLTVGLGFLIASVARDMMSVMSWGILAILLLVLPALGVLVPGAMTNWIKLLPSYFLVDIVYRASNFNMGWLEASGSLLLLLAAALLIFGLGVAVLRRKFQ